MTFKQDEKTGCWLLYQEYLEDFMKHSHKLERRQYADIRDYIREYHDKVRNLSELKDLIQDKFGYEYTLNQISYFKGRWTTDATMRCNDNNDNDL